MNETPQADVVNVPLHQEPAHLKRRFRPLDIIEAGLLALIAISIGLTFLYTELRLRQAQTALETEVTQLKEHMAVITDSFDAQLAAITDTLQLTQEENDQLAATLAAEQENVARELERELERIGDDVSDLNKLSRTDPELLQKYSKVFFLNEHYTPERLVEIDRQWVWGDSDVERIHAQVEPFLEDMLEEAEDDGIEMFVASAYRSFDEQATIKGLHTVVYGQGTANTFSADQGYSEHQLGTTIDLTTPALNGALDGFETTDAYQWMLRNAYKYGFTLSYPPDNEYYIFEPWHWRFVGRDLARDLHRDEKYFYDLDQRDIDEYLIELFD